MLYLSHTLSQFLPAPLTPPRWGGLTRSLSSSCCSSFFFCFFFFFFCFFFFFLMCWGLQNPSLSGHVNDRAYLVIQAPHFLKTFAQTSECHAVFKVAAPPVLLRAPLYLRWNCSKLHPHATAAQGIASMVSVPSFSSPSCPFSASFPWPLPAKKKASELEHARKSQFV